MSAEMTQLKVKSKEPDILDTTLLTPTAALAPASQPVSPHKEPAAPSVRGHDPLQKLPPQTAVALDLGVSLPKRPVSLSKFETVTSASTPPAGYVPTVLDKLVSFFANLLKRLERFLVGKLEKRRKLRRKVVRRFEAEEPEIRLPTLEEEPEQPFTGNHIKWKDRKIKDLEF